jgi:hypothetical protein
MNKYYRQFGEYTVCKVQVGCKLIYEVWAKECLGRFDSYKEALNFLNKGDNMKQTLLAIALLTALS